MDSPGNVYIGTDGSVLQCLDGRDGRLLWSYSVGGPIYSSSPVIGEDAVYVGTDII
jgi:outer membrane protein assembly factor BamB